MIFFTYAPKSYFPRNGSFSEHFVYGLIEPDLSSGSILINHREYPKVCVNLQTDVR